jgi:hypothetical protein
MARKRKKAPAAPKVDTTASATSLAQQLDKANGRISDLEATLRAYRARLDIKAGTEKHPHRGDPDKNTQVILERMAAALQLASVAELAHQTGAIHDGPPATGLRDIGRPMPGSGTHPARSRANDLRNDITDALGRFEWASENVWRRKPPPDRGVPQVRCGNRDCAAYDIHEDAWRRIRGGKTIYREVCPTCGTPYGKANENGDAA